MFHFLQEQHKIAALEEELERANVKVNFCEKYLEQNSTTYSMDICASQSIAIEVNSTMNTAVVVTCEIRFFGLRFNFNKCACS